MFNKILFNRTSFNKMGSIEKRKSASRSYVAICYKLNFNGFYLKKFKLPFLEENTVDHAVWYFLNKLDFTACLDKVITFEEYSDITEVEN